MKSVHNNKNSTSKLGKGVIGGVIIRSGQDPFMSHLNNNTSTREPKQAKICSLEGKTTIHWIITSFITYLFPECNFSKYLTNSTSLVKFGSYGLNFTAKTITFALFWAGIYGLFNFDPLGIFIYYRCYHLSSGELIIGPVFEECLVFESLHWTYAVGPMKDITLKKPCFPHNSRTIMATISL